MTRNLIRRYVGLFQRDLRDVKVPSVRERHEYSRDGFQKALMEHRFVRRIDIRFGHITRYSHKRSILHDTLRTRRQFIQIYSYMYP